MTRLLGTASDTAQVYAGVDGESAHLAERCGEWFHALVPGDNSATPLMRTLRTYAASPGTGPDGADEYQYTARRYFTPKATVTPSYDLDGTKGVQSPSRRRKATATFEPTRSGNCYLLNDGR